MREGGEGWRCEGREEGNKGWENKERRESEGRKEMKTQLCNN